LEAHLYRSIITGAAFFAVARLIRLTKGQPSKYDARTVGLYLSHFDLT
jgi:hypothetical protein